MKKTIYKFAAVLLVISMFSGVFSVGKSYAYFSDTATISGNTFIAGILDISLDNTSTYSSGLMYPSDATTTTISISNIGSLNSQYIASTTIIGSKASACDYVTMTATSPDNSFTGLIKNFISNATSTTNAVWNYNFTIDPSTPPSVWGKTCFFKWTYTAWQSDLLNSSSGFSSVKEKLGSVRIGKAVVLNEFIPDPTGLDNAPKPGGEWVELFNNSSVSFDLGNWFIYDSTDDGEVPIDVSHTGSGSTSIAPHSFIVVYRNGDSDFNLNNTAGSVRLFTKRISSGGVLVDSYSWTTAKPEGFSYARIPDGVGAWVDPVPTPGWTNDFSEIFEIKLPEISYTTASTIVEQTASTTLEVASTTPEIASTTPDTLPVNIETASTTPEVIEPESVVVPLNLEEAAISELTQEPVIVPETIIELVSAVLEVLSVEPPPVTE